MQLPDIPFKELEGVKSEPMAAISARFKTDEYQILLVANKFQTGFNQPLLCGMCVDKRDQRSDEGAAGVDATRVDPDDDENLWTGDD